MKIMQVISTIPLIADNGENVSVNTVSPKVVTHPTMEAKNININKNFLMFIYIIITRACAHTDRKSPDFNVVINEGTIGENACACVM